MKKLIIIGGDRQPIPPVEGGAVENLTQMFIDSNEKLEEFKIIVLSCFSKKIENMEFSEKHVEYRFIKKTTQSRILQVINSIMNKITGKTFIWKTKYVDKIINEIKKIEDYDYIFIENYINAVLPISKKCKNKKIILHLHNDKLNRNTIKGKKIVEACDKIITVSDYIKRRICTIENINQKKIFTIINSIYVDRFGNKKIQNIEKIKEKLNIKKEDLVIFFAGRIAKTKGVKELVMAFKNLKKENIKLVITGNSWYGNSSQTDKYKEELREYSKEIEKNVIFTGYIDYNEMPDYYSIADIVVIPSTWQEPCSLTLFETMASNVPLITTNTGGTPEVVKNYAIQVDVNNQIIINLTKKIEELLDDKEKRKKMAAEAYEYVQQYNPERYYKEITKLLIEN